MALPPLRNQPLNTRAVANGQGRTPAAVPRARVVHGPTSPTPAPSGDVGLGTVLKASAAAVAALVVVAGVLLFALKTDANDTTRIGSNCIDLGRPVATEKQTRIEVEVTLDGDVQGPKMRDMRFLATAIEFCRPGSCDAKRVQELGRLLDIYIETRIRDSTEYYRRGGDGALRQINRLYDSIEDRAIWRQLQYLSDAGTLDLDRHSRNGRAIRFLLSQPDQSLVACAP